MTFSQALEIRAGITAVIGSGGKSTLLEVLARELGSRGVTVNAIAPGFIETDMTAVLPENIKEGLLGSIPLGRLGQAEEVAALAAFLCSEQAGYITGQVIHVDGGMAM